MVIKRELTRPPSAPNRQLSTAAADCSVLRDMVLIKCMAKVRFDDRLATDIEFGSNQIKLAKHLDGEVDVHSLDRLLHAAPVGEIC